VERQRLHLSLLTLGEYMAAPDPAELEAHRARIDAAVAALVPRAPRLCMDSAMTLGKRGEPRKMPFVLCFDEDSRRAVLDLCQPLALALLGKAPRSFTPHLSLAYDRTWVARDAIEPLGWTARRLVLILSHVGRKEYEHIGEWELNAV
jgi:2'-5' RNA ligase